MPEGKSGTRLSSTQVGIPRGRTPWAQAVKARQPVQSRSSSPAVLVAPPAPAPVAAVSESAAMSDLTRHLITLTQAVSALRQEVGASLAATQRMSERMDNFDKLIYTLEDQLMELGDRINSISPPPPRRREAKSSTPDGTAPAKLPGSSRGAAAAPRSPARHSSSVSKMQTDKGPAPAAAAVPKPTASSPPKSAGLGLPRHPALDLSDDDLY